MVSYPRYSGAAPGIDTLGNMWSFDILFRASSRLTGKKQLTDNYLLVYLTKIPGLYCGIIRK